MTAERLRLRLRAAAAVCTRPSRVDGVLTLSSDSSHELEVGRREDDIREGLRAAQRGVRTFPQRQVVREAQTSRRGNRKVRLSVR